MPSLPHIPLLRFGRAYRSLDAKPITCIRTGAVLAEMSIANAGVIRRDGRGVRDAFDALQAYRCEELIDISAKAAELFMNGELPLGMDGQTQTSDDYGKCLSATSGLPHVMVRRNMAKIHHVLANMATIIGGLTRGMDLGAIDEGFGEQGGVAVSFFPTTQSMGAVLPSNSPGVNSLWLPALPLKIPIILKPGSEEPWTPWRLIQAFIAAGMPGEAIGFFPTTHEGSQAILETAGRALLFGDQKTIDRYAGDPSVEVHGPGFSKVLIGEDEIDNWQSHLDTIEKSILANGGRSCINASCIVVPRHADAIAEALARRFAAIGPTAPEDENARISAFANPAVAEWVDEKLTEELKDDAAGGAVDVTARFRSESRLTQLDGATYLRPTLVRCAIDHPLGNTEFMFPYASVVELPQNEMLSRIGPTLVGSVITKDETFSRQCLAGGAIERLNLGEIPTSVVEWDQPHEGNLFEFLYRRRAIQRQLA